MRLKILNLPIKFFLRQFSGEICSPQDFITEPKIKRGRQLIQKQFHISLLISFYNKNIDIVAKFLRRL